jgi:DNA polymerase III epsilon subunit-like protein
VTQVVVLDVETTGFGEYDRIIEVAGVIFDTDFGEVIGEF